ncbi:GNAT family N-acetyltransferase [Bacillus timonensis]|nr:GNAT family N-acetyltransferase [Bacillus timonensis]
MADLTFTKLTDQREELVSFLTRNRWDFHGAPSLTKQEVKENFNNGNYHNGKETFWVEQDGEKIGLLTINDIEDSIPLIDIRLAQAVRGKGLGKSCVNWLINYVFTLPDKKIRLEAYTRSDNLAMRKTLIQSGFVKEGYLRQAWEQKDGTLYDAVIYGIIRSDWEKKVTTLTKFDELPF